MEPEGIDRGRPGEDLDRDIARQARVARSVDLTHAAGAYPLQYLVRSEERTRLEAQRPRLRELRDRILVDGVNANPPRPARLDTRGSSIVAVSTGRERPEQLLTR